MIIRQRGWKTREIVNYLVQIVGGDPQRIDELLFRKLYFRIRVFVGML